jgi:hypothetical protein
MRRRARAVRAAVPAAERAVANTRLRGHLMDWLGDRRGAALAGFWPLGGEVDLKPLLASWHRAGGVALLPRMQGEAMPLRFHRWTPETTLEVAAFNVEEPPAASPAHRPDVVLVPLLAVDPEDRTARTSSSYRCWRSIPRATGSATAAATTTAPWPSSATSTPSASPSTFSGWTRCPGACTTARSPTSSRRAA